MGMTVDYSGKIGEHADRMAIRQAIEMSSGYLCA